jgi:anti-anti-sigma factor
LLAPSLIGVLLRQSDSAAPQMNVTDSDEQGVAEGLGPEFRLAVTRRADGALLVPEGELDLATAPRLKTALSGQTEPVVVDLRQLSLVDATGLRVLLEVETHSRQNGMNVRFIAGEAVRRVFEAAAVPDTLTYVEPEPT